jgi:hypothetical protein
VAVAENGGRATAHHAYPPAAASAAARGTVANGGFMVYRVLADAVVLLHLGFILFVALGALLAWRWPALLWAHLPAVAWAAGTVVIGFPCPLTALEKDLRNAAGDGGYPGGFIDHYVEGVVYPERYTLALRALAAGAVVAGYLGLRRRAQAVS